MLKLRSTVPIIVCFVILAGCAGTNPLVPDDLPQNRAPVPEANPNPGTVPNYGGELKSEAEQEAAIRELQDAGDNQAAKTEADIKRRKY